MQSQTSGWRGSAPISFVLVVAALSCGACSEQIVETSPPLGGTCLACHDGITEVHPFFALACVDCHGGNDSIRLPSVVNIRDQDLLKRSHVLPLDASMWWPNGIDDNGDGRVDEIGEFFDGRALTATDTPFADARLANKGQMDSEVNRDLNYLRFLNPGDLRVADASCGSRNSNANAAMVCHAEVVYDVRRSMMSTNAGVPMAVYGNAQLPQATDFGTPFAASAAGSRFDARAGRVGRVGYTINYSAIDDAFDSASGDAARNLVAGGAFDRGALADAAGASLDPEDDAFEAIAGPIFDDGITGSDAAFDAPRGFTRTGQAIRFFVTDLDAPGAANNRAVDVLQNISNRAGRSWPDQRKHPGLQLRLARIVGEVVPALKEDRQATITNLFDGRPITNPVDAALRNFRAYHAVNWWGPSDNFGFVDFMTSPNAADPPPPNPANTELRNKNNPFGRGRASGCTACHVVYGKDGHNEEPVDRTVADNGRQPETDLPLGIRQDLGQHAYARRHEITRVVKTEQCGACHGFVTRVDVAMAGTYEQEADLTNLETITTVGPIRYPTPKGTTVNLFDNLAHYKNGRLLNDGEGLSEDLNNNGELDTALEERDENDDGILQPNEDLNKNGHLDVGLAISEDKNGNGLLDIPDRVRRSDAFDGRQSRIVYGGQNGAIRLQDIHLERGFNCVDCHIQNDVHGDSNIYTRNWDAVQIECEDCHGSNDTPPSLIFSGPNGGDDMTSSRYQTAFGEPWFERRGDRLFQRSRVQKDLGWFVPTLVSPRDNASAYAHRQPLETFSSNLDHDTEHCAPFVDENSCSAAGCAWTGAAEGATCQGYERRYAHVAEPGENGGLECYACHSSWQPNCLSCHIKMDVAKSKQEIWWGDDDVEDIFFQLFSFTRSPFYLGRAGNTERNRVAPYRSTMQVHLTVVAGGIQLAESAVFSTTENLSSLASNPYFPHTVRTQESKSCARCHTLTDDAGRIENDHLITEATGQGTGRYQNLGDWAAVGTAAGLDLLDLKREAKGAVTFPGFDFSDADGGGEQRRRVSFDLSINDDDSPASGIFDLALHRGVSLANGSGDVTDVVIVGHEGGVSVVDVFGRDNNDFGIGGLRDRTVGLPPTVLARLDSTGPVRSVDIVDAAASQSTTFVALTDEELLVLDYRQALDVARATGTDGLNLLDPDAGTPQDDGDGDGDGALDIDAAAQGMVVVGSLTHSLDAPTRARLSGRFVLVSHAQGLAVFQLADASGATRQADIDLGPPVAELVSFETSRPALDVAVFGRFAYVAVGEAGVEVFDIGPVTMPLVQRDGSPQGVSRAPVGSIFGGQGQIADSRGLAVWGSRLVVADGVHGLRVVDVSVPADPRLEETIALGGAANTVVMAEVPTRTFAIVGSDTAVFAVNLTPSTDVRTQLAAAAAAPDAFRGLRLSFELADPLTPSDAKNATRQVLRFPTSAPVRAIARGLALDAIADRGGRRLRDAWAIGARPLELPTIARMRSVVVKEVPGTGFGRGDGLGCIVREGDAAGVQQDATTLRCLPAAAP